MIANDALILQWQTCARTEVLKPCVTHGFGPFLPLTRAQHMENLEPVRCIRKAQLASNDTVRSFSAWHAGRNDMSELFPDVNVPFKDVASAHDFVDMCQQWQLKRIVRNQTLRALGLVVAVTILRAFVTTRLFWTVACVVVISILLTNLDWPCCACIRSHHLMLLMRRSLSYYLVP